MIADLDARQLAALTCGALACGFDVRTRHIPNALTLGGAAVALAHAGVFGGWTLAGESALGWLAGCALFAPFFLLGGMGAGDVKLLACLGAWLGPDLALWTALYGSIAGGVAALAVSLASGYSRQAITNLSLMLLQWQTTGLRPVTDLTLGSARGPRLPYALPITAGVMAALWLRP